MSTDDFGFDLDVIFTNTAEAVDYLLQGLGKLGEGLMDVATVGSDFLPGLMGGENGEGGFLGWAQRFADSMERMRESGELKEWIQGAIDKFGELWHIGGQIIDLIDNILDPAEETGDGMLGSISQTLDKWNEFLSTTEGQDRIRKFFEDVKDTCSAIADIISGAAEVAGYFVPSAPSDKTNPDFEPSANDGGETGYGSKPKVGDGSSSTTPQADLEPSLGDRANRIFGLGSANRPAANAGSPFLGSTDENGVYKRDFFGRAWEQIAGFGDELGKVGDWFGGGVYDGIEREEGQSPASALWNRMFGGDDEPAPSVPTGQGPRGARNYDALASQFDDVTGADSSGGGFWDTAKNGWQGFADTVGSTYSDVSGWLGDVTSKAGELGTGFFDDVKVRASDAWNGLKDDVVSGWSEHIGPTWETLRTEGLGGLADSFLTSITGGAVPSWGELPAAIGSGVSDIVDTHFPGLRTGLEGVRGFFSEIGQGIKDIWSSVTSFLAEKIDWVIANVINGGIGRAYSSVDNFLLGKLPDWTDVPLIGMETGGFVPREPGTQWGKDGVVRLLAPGEVVMSKPAVDAAGAQNLLDFNCAAQQGKGPQSEGMFAIGMETGGRVTKDDPAWDAMKRGHDFAKAQDGKPYQWAGPRFVNDSFDCSGFMSSIAAAILGQYTWQRYFYTGSFNGGENGPMGFKRVLGAGFSIGVHDDPGGPGGGHTAGTLSGIEGLPDINVESGGMAGDVQYGGQAAGASNSQFPWKYHLPIVDGAFVDPGPGGGGNGPDKKGFLTSKAEQMIHAILSPIRDKVNEIGIPPPAFMEALPALFEKVTAPFSEFVTSKIDGLGDAISGIYDTVKDAVGDGIDWLRDLNPLNRDTGGSLPRV